MVGSESSSLMMMEHCVAGSRGNLTLNLYTCRLMDSVYGKGVIGPNLDKAIEDYSSIVALGKVLQIIAFSAPDLSPCGNMDFRLEKSMGTEYFYIFFE